MKPSIEEIPNPGEHRPSSVGCGGRPRYLAVLQAADPSATRGAFPVCNECANDACVLDGLGATAEEF